MRGDCRGVVVAFGVEVEVGDVMGDGDGPGGVEGW